MERNGKERGFPDLCLQVTEVELTDLDVLTKLLAEHSVVAARVYQRLVRGFFWT